MTSEVRVFRDGNAWIPIMCVRSDVCGVSIPWEAEERYSDRNEARKRGSVWARENGWRFVDA